MSIEKQVTYSTTNTYSTLNNLSDKTKNIWMVFHGMGYLSRYFIRYFSEIDRDENYIVALQAPSKYYQDSAFKRIGASWLTRENTMKEMKNILNYIDAVYAKEVPSTFKNNLIVMGYSQGVSIASRWVAKRKIDCNYLLLHSGGIPKELTAEDFSFLSPATKVIYTYGNKDQYVTEARKTEEQLKGKQLFGNRLSLEIFDGIHEVNRGFLLKISEEGREV